MDSLPTFPNFRLFTIEDIDWYYEYYLNNKLNPYVDINPANLFVWLGINNDLSICKLNEAIILRYTNVLNNNQNNVIPLSNPLSNSVVGAVMQLLKENDLPLELVEVPSNICRELDPTLWQTEDDRNSYEYILDVNQQVKLIGSDFYKQRNYIKSFEREHANDLIDIKFYNDFNEDVKEMFLHHISTMPFNSNPEAAQRNLVEPIAIRRNLELASKLQKKALIIKINDEVVSLSMVAYLDQNAAAINHLKVDYSLPNIFRYTVYQLAKTLKENGINEMNFEQDLGIPGLRTFKELMRPSRYLEKKTIKPRHQ